MKLTLKTNNIFMRMFFTLSLVFTILVASNFLYANTVQPPAHNAPAPINVSTVTQDKLGALSLGGLLVNGDAHVNNQVRAFEYCDRDGLNCFSAPDVTGGGGGGGNEIVYLPAPVEIISQSQLTGVSSYSYDFGTGAYPSNIVRLYTSAFLVGSAGTPAGSEGGAHGIEWDAVPPVPSTISYYFPLQVSPKIILSSPNGRVFAWIPVNGNILEFKARLVGLDRKANVEISGYECAGPCAEVVVSRTCEVYFESWINGNEVKTTRTITGAKNDRFGIGMSADGDSKAAPLPYTEQIHTFSWGSAWNDGSENINDGYFAPLQYEREKTRLDALNTTAMYTISSIPLQSGQNRRIVNSAVKEIAYSTGALFVKVNSCTK